MTRDNWREAVADIEKATALASARQHKLASVAGITLPADIPQLVAAAQLRSALGEDIGVLDTSEVRDVQREILAALEAPKLRITMPPQNADEAEAWINFLRLKRRQQALGRLQLMAGDIVEVNDAAQVAEISSIGSNGRIYFKGSTGGGSWPDKVILRCRRDDVSRQALDLKRQAANKAALGARIDSWTIAKRDELIRFSVETTLTLETVEQFQGVIDQARNERPIQDFIEEHPELLAALLGGRDRFVLPRHALAGKYVPDFLASDTDSLGIRWLLVELETPITGVTLRNVNQLDAIARKGVSQIKDWREWLQNNLDMARRQMTLDGLGLIDIRPMSEGLVLVGRRGLLNDNASAVRNPYREQSAIRIHTYDWLIERLLGILEYVGPPRTSPDIIRPLRQSSDWS